MQSIHHSPSPLQSLHEILSTLPDVFCTQVCHRCQWSISSFYFHLHNPGHLKEKEKKKINKIVRNVLATALAELPKTDATDINAVVKIS